jgi:hypothetical protein
MFSSRQRSIRFAWVGMALLALAPAPGRTETIALRNDTRTAVRVDASSVFAGRVFRTRQILLNPKAATVPGIMLPGDKIITIRDANVPTRILFQGTIPVGTADQGFLIQTDVSPRVKLMPTSFPLPPAP